MRFGNVKRAKLFFYPDAGILLASVKLCPVIQIWYIKYPGICLLALTNCRQVNSLCWKCFDLVQVVSNQVVSEVAQGMGALLSLAEAAPASKSGKPWGEMFSVHRFLCLLTANLGEFAVSSSRCSGSENQTANVFQGEKETLLLKPVFISCECFTHGLRFGNKRAQLFFNAVLEGFFWDMTTTPTAARNTISYHLESVLIQPSFTGASSSSTPSPVIGSRIWSFCLQWWHLQNKRLLFQNVWVYYTLRGILQ